MKHINLNYDSFVLFQNEDTERNASTIEETQQTCHFSLENNIEYKQNYSTKSLIHQLSIK